MTRTTCALLALCCLVSCESPVLPPPTIVSVMPERIAEGGASVLTIEVSAVLPVSVDYEENQAAVAPLTLFIAGEQTEVAFSQQGGRLVASVPAGLARGAYDVEVALADGREAVREQAFSVVAPAELRPEDLPVRGGLTGFQIDTIGDQVEGVPFKVTIRAQGPEASSFQGTGVVRATKGQGAPITTGAFAGGVVQQEVTFDKPSAQIVLLVEDSLGNMGMSNPFRVRPK